MGKKLLGVATIIILIFIFYKALKIASGFVGMVTSPIGAVVGGLILLLFCFLLYKFLRWCFAS